MKRVVVPELLDSDAGTPDEITASLADLRWFNRYFGGHATTLALLRKVHKGLGSPPQFSYVDVAGASSDGIAYAQCQLSGVAINTVVVDRSPQHLASNITAVCGDAIALPFRDSSFDVVGCSLFIHHLEPNEIAQFIREALRVTRHAVVINDLVRSPVHYWSASAGRIVYKSRITRHDAPASVRRAYTPAELGQVLASAGCARVEFTRHYFYRMGVIIWR